MFGGYPPASFPVGGSSALGSVGWVGGGLEIAAQVAAGELPTPDRIYVALGSGGTAAGLLVGLRLAGLPSEVVAVRHSQNGRTLRARRLGDEEGLTPGDRLDDFVGRYRCGASSVLAVSREGRQLFAQLTGQPRYPIFYETGDRFAWHAVQANAGFLRDAGGKVTGVRHTQNGRNFVAPKIADLAAGAE